MVTTQPAPQLSHPAKFDALVKRLESFAQRRPGAYKLRVGLLAILGYVYIFLMLVILLVIAALSIGIVVALISGGGVYAFRILFSLGKLSIVLLGVMLVPLFMVWDLVRSLWVHIPPPQGIRLRRRDVPLLFACVDDLTGKLKAPRFNHILLTPEFNAAVVQRPRLGLFGWYESYLLLGLPLLQAVSVPQFEAILAHELGHLSGNHSRFAGWIYRLRLRWMQLLERFQRNGGSSLFNWFVNWYAPFFNAYSFVMARMDEYEADRCAAKVAGPQNVAEALISVQLKGRFLQDSYWSEVYKQVECEPDPPAIAFTSLLKALRQPIAAGEGKEWLEQALVQCTNNEDTHPCLSDRLRALGYLTGSGQALSLPQCLQVSAAEQLLSHQTEQFVTQFDRDWQQEVATPWRQRYAYIQELLQKLADVERCAETRSLTVDEAWVRAYCTFELKGWETALPLIQTVLAMDADHVPANYAVGHHLLQQDDVDGIAYLERAMAKDPDGVIETCQTIYTFLLQRGEAAAAQTFEMKAQTHYGLLQKAEQERSQVSDRDAFKPHTLTSEAVAAICQQVANYPEVKEAYLVEKVLTYFPERRFCVLGIVRKRNLIESEDAPQRLVNQLVQNVQMPMAGYIIVLNHRSAGKLQEKIAPVERSCIFQRRER